jgi:AmmeMemoRadiSam system protein B
VGGVRLPVAAGTFYPGGPNELADVVDRLLTAATARAELRPWGVIVPHAGYAYSGPVAASAYAALRPWADEIARVAILGPAHFVPIDGCAVSSAPAWRTPLGDVPVDGELRAAAVDAGCAVDDRAHAPEHAIELQLPFLQRLLGARLRFLPVAVGEAADMVESVLEVVGSLADLFVASTDLSHYHRAETARALDRRTADAVLARDPGGIGPADACGRDALRAVLAHARRRGMEIELLDLRTSADTSGDAERVVGYGAFAIGPEAPGG